MLTFLHDLPALVENRYREGDGATVWLPDFALGLNQDLGMNGVANKHGSQELPMDFRKARAVP